MARGSQPHGITKRTGPEAMDDDDLLESCQRGVVEVAIERLECLLDPRAAEVERRGARPCPIQPDRADAAPASRCDSHATTHAAVAEARTRLAAAPGAWRPAGRDPGV